MNQEDVKSSAYKFLQSLARELDSNMPPPTEMRRLIDQTVAEAKGDPPRKHMRGPENVFLNQYAIPIVFRHMQGVDGIGVKEAKQSLLSEFYRNMKDYAFWTPARTRGHLSPKYWGQNPLKSSLSGRVTMVRS
jgi:hypothetical protein